MTEEDSPIRYMLLNMTSGNQFLVALPKSVSTTQFLTYASMSHWLYATQNGVWGSDKHGNWVTLVGVTHFNPDNIEVAIQYPFDMAVRQGAVFDGNMSEMPEIPDTIPDWMEEGSDPD